MDTVSESGTRYSATSVELGPLERKPIRTKDRQNEIPIERNPNRTKTHQNEFPSERICKILRIIVALRH